MIRRIVWPFLALAALLGLSSLSEAQDLLVTNFDNGTISRFSLNGQFLGTFATGLFYATGMALGPDGDVYVANGDGSIIKYSTTGVDLGIFATTAGPRGLAFDKSGDLYVAQFTNVGAVQEFSPTGVDLGNFTITGLSFPRGIAFDSAGNLYASSATGAPPFANTLTKFSPTGTDEGFYAQAPALDLPFGLAFNAGGDLFVANDGNGTVREFSPTGVDLGNFATGLGGASGLTFDSEGNLYVATNANNTIDKFSPSGVDLGTFSNPNLAIPKFLIIVPASATPEPGACTLLGGFCVTGLAIMRFRRIYRINGYRLQNEGRCQV